METSMEPVTVRIGALDLRFLVDEHHGAGEMILFEFTVPPEARVPAPHHHAAVDEAVYGLAGILTVTVDGIPREIRAGDVAFIPRGAVHHHENRHEEIARALVLLTPGSIGRAYFEEMAAAVAGPDRPDPARVREIMLRHGLVPA
ncbi:cupin domain-containing protein [Teichococcus aerofrigidensis]